MVIQKVLLDMDQQEKDNHSARAHATIYTEMDIKLCFKLKLKSIRGIKTKYYFSGGFHYSYQLLRVTCKRLNRATHTM